VEESGRSPKEIVEEEGLAQVSDVRALEELAKKLVEENPEQVKKFRGGKESLIGWFVGQIMRQTQGKADPEVAKKVLLEQLKE
jgi:aspartyl-tRNA(Asn)/glutamyl-tRNA(Gln) amidotransferase subunit B